MLLNFVQYMAGKKPWNGECGCAGADTSVERTAGTSSVAVHARLYDAYGIHPHKPNWPRLCNDPVANGSGDVAPVWLAAGGDDGRAAHEFIDTRPLFMKFGELAARELALARYLDRQRINEASVDKNFVVQVRTGGQSG